MSCSGWRLAVGRRPRASATPGDTMHRASTDAPRASPGAASTGARRQDTAPRSSRLRRCGAVLGAAVILAMGALGPRAHAADASPARASPQQQLLDALAAVVAKQPRHVGALYVAARTAASMGDEATAIQWLDRLADVGMDDELDPDDFGAFADTAAYRERAARFAAKAPPIGSPMRERETRCADLLPEGTAWDAKRGELLISSGRRRTVVAVDATGRCRDVVPPGDGGLLAVLGMTVDPAADALWVASTAAPFMIDRRPEEAGRTSLARIDLARGSVSRVYPLPGPGMLNDLALARDGAVYVTESQGGTVWTLPAGGTALVPLLPPATFESPNGIVWLAPSHLLVADFDGLALVSLSDGNVGAPRVRRLATPGDVYLGGIDGLARTSRGVIGVQNLVGRTRVWALTIDLAQARVSRAEVILRGHPDFRNPTTGVVIGDRLVFVADTKLQAPTAHGEVTPLPAGRTGHRVLEVRVP